MSLELDVAREKEHTRKAEYRFQNRRMYNRKSSLNNQSSINNQEDESTGSNSLLPEEKSTDWDSDSDMPINVTSDVTSYGATSATKSILGKGIAESSRKASELEAGTTPVHSTFVASKAALRTTGFSGSNKTLGAGNRGGLHIASPARPPLSSGRGRHSNGNVGRVSRRLEDNEEIRDSNHCEGNENVDNVMRSSISSLPPPPPSAAAKLPARAHSMSPLRRNDDMSTSTGISSLAPPSPAGSDVSGRFSRLQKMYERVTAKEQSRETKSKT